MKIKLQHFKDSPNFKLWKASDNSEIGFLIINASKSTLRSFVNCPWSEIKVSSSAKIILENGETYFDVVVLHLKKKTQNFEIVRSSLNSYFPISGAVYDYESFRKMYAHLHNLFSLTHKDLFKKAQGLFGELWYIYSTLKVFPHLTLTSWQSEKSKTLIDFNYSDNFKVEVKTYGESGLIHFNGIRQLKPREFPQNYLTVAIRLNHDEQGETLRSLYGKILQSLPVESRELFEQRLNISSDSIFNVLSAFAFRHERTCVFSMKPYEETVLHNSITLKEVFLDINEVKFEGLDSVYDLISNSFTQ